MDITSFVLGYKKGKAEGGGALTEDVCHVTFMNGDTVLYEKPVFVGDDCTDIVKKGTIGTPSKASTPQYNYTYTGWSLTNGGEASTGALASVSGDRTVYAAYTSAVRYYTVTYLDEDGSVLKTETLAYGAMPSYMPTKDGYDFAAWTPNEPVTGDMVYTATWNIKATFETATWAQIGEICAAGNAGTAFHVGDEKPFTITHPDGTTEENVFIIAAMNTTATGNSTTTASLTLVTKYAMESTRRYHNASDGTTYINSEIKKWGHEELFAMLPTDLQAVIKPKYLIEFIGIKECNCWIPDLKELNLTKSGATPSSSYSKTLALFSQGNNNTRVRTLGKNGLATTYWVADTVSSGVYTRGVYITETGTVYGGQCVQTDKRGVVFCVCI